MVADYKSKQEDGSIPVYILNGTGKPLDLFAEDGDPFLKLEVQESNGQWTRAQTHLWGGCLDSYVRALHIAQGGFALRHGYQPSEGKSCTVRYRLHLQGIEVISNSGTALVAAGDIALASCDELSIRNSDFEHLTKVALGILKPVDKDVQTSVQITAILNIGSGTNFDAANSREVLLKVKASVPEMAIHATTALQMLKERAKSGNKK